MFDVPSFRIGRLFGIPLEINASWLVIFALASFSLSTAYFPSLQAAQGAPRWLFWAVGAVTAILFFASIVVHELCHSLVARAQGGHVDRITLFLFGGVAQIDEEPTSAGREFLMAAAGPGMSLLIAAGCFLAAGFAVSVGAPWWIGAPLEYLSFINLAVGIFNLLPGFPLDGGRVLRSVLWGLTGDLLRATRWAVRVGQLIGWGLVTLAVVDMLGGQTRFIWLGLIGWFIATLAGQALRQQVVRSALAGETVERVMSPTPEYVDGEQSVEQLVNEHFLGRRHSRYPVIYGGSIVGLVTLPDVKAVDRSEWPIVRTVDVTNRNLEELVVSPSDPVESTLARLAGDRPGALLVVGDGRLVGILTRADLIGVIERNAAARRD